MYQQKFFTIRLKPENSRIVEVLDQRVLPFKESIIELHTSDDAIHAIKEMVVRGAPLIGITAAYGLYLACLEAPFQQAQFSNHVKHVAEKLIDARPTAVNLKRAVDLCLDAMHSGMSPEAQTKIVLQTAIQLEEEDQNANYKIGEFGLGLLEEILANKKNGEPIQILTHCNAGALGCTAWGTATAPMYLAKEKGLNIHVWVDETRPRNQGYLTAWELEKQNIPHTLITDNTGGLLMLQHKIDLVIVGADRVTKNGDTANKIGTYLKAVAAKDNNIPFYVALPLSTYDPTLADGVKEIEIEERNGDEIRFSSVWNGEEVHKMQTINEEVKVYNPGFDITPSRLITGFITENGVLKPDQLV
jgi:methylthioribose-1-phosphate isomerase